MNHAPSPVDKIQDLRTFSGHPTTPGIPLALLEPFLAGDANLRRAIDEAWTAHIELRAEWAEQLALPEDKLCEFLQEHYLNFYGPAATNPYVALAARGPWIVTSHGAVLHDSGGYGMLGLGHGPDVTLGVMARPWVQANVMTPSFSQRRLSERLRRVIGKGGACPYGQFLCMNSGSEAMTVALRISDIHARTLTEPGGRHVDKETRYLSLAGSFHGRTDRPAQVSDSTWGKYHTHLGSFRYLDALLTVEPNDVEGLHKVFRNADNHGTFIEAMIVEPVQGEGNPGCGITRAFYDAARALTRERGTFLIVDSIQAGLRAHGCLSIVDYPGFEGCDAPDMETYSKALNAGQYPLSVLALREEAARFFVRGTYGNTMTTNPRALEVACAVLDALTPDLTGNVAVAGKALHAVLEDIQARYPCILKVQGTGLLLSAQLDERVPVEGGDGLEHYLRTKGLGIIHGARNSLRFTPHLGITQPEIELIGKLLEQGLGEYLEE